MFRPPSDAFYYQAAYVIGLAVVAALTWTVMKFSRGKHTRRIALTAAILIASLAAVALREEFRVMRAEVCYRTIQEINRGNSKGFRTHYGFACRVGPDGTIVSSCGTPQEIEDFLRRKYRSWFTGTLIRIRNRLLPTSSCTLSAGAAEA
jgi:hypothetical protein